MMACASPRCPRKSRRRSRAEPCSGLASISILALLPLVVRDHLKEGPIAYGTLSIYYALAHGGMAAGSWIWGSVAETYSLTLALEEAAAALLVVAAAAFVLPMRPWDDSDQETADVAEPSLALELKPEAVPSSSRLTTRRRGSTGRTRAAWTRPERARP